MQRGYFVINKCTRHGGIKGLKNALFISSVYTYIFLNYFLWLEKEGEFDVQKYKELWSASMPHIQQENILQ